MEEYNLKTKVVGVDISNELTTYAIVDVRGNILAEDSFPTTDYPDVNNFVTALRPFHWCQQSECQLRFRLYRECRQPALEGDRASGSDAA